VTTHQISENFQIWGCIENGIRKLELLPSDAKVMVRSITALWPFQESRIFLQFGKAFAAAKW